ncbi:SdrD B-like domain-containing protein [Spirosoma fluviale]|uniref:SdrD B-like domain n=1 Tax=Spirosoma fluviale TaxID=1597977 RepID=A0A286G561_9BACT|nr:SdrD B-like domain-containing protein [Spirosoma fluviale]SOD90690.1 SdrD B-like domain [Spirosoma fluviale]
MRTRFTLTDQSSLDQVLCGNITRPGSTLRPSRPRLLTGATLSRAFVFHQLRTTLRSWWVMSFLLGLLAFSFSTQAQTCDITLKPTVSGCYSPDGVASKATVSIEVGWINAPAGTITVSYMGQTKTITPGLITVNYGFTVGNQPQTIVSPQVVAFEVDLPGTAQTATATFDTSPTCTATSAPIVLPAACPRRKCDNGELAGTVFNDFNADGIRQAGESAGIPGVTVTAIACDGTIYTATTDAFGDYNLTIPAINYPVRVEFTNLPAYAGQGTLNGTDGRTTVQFVQSANCTIDLGVLDPVDYCQTNPKIVVPCYLNGDPYAPGSATDAAIVSFDYTLDVASKTGIAKIPEIGAVWGTAYAKKDNSVYTAAVLRRHTGLTDAGLGGIFKTKLTDNTTTLFVDVETLGVNLGSISSNAARGLGAKDLPSQDEEAYSKVGKTGMGDLDISGDGSTLYFVNLFEKKLHSLSTTNPTAAPGVAIPNPGCGTSGDYRPWALKIYKGFVYVGVVCDAATGSKSNLRAYIYKYDISTNTFNTTPVLDFPLTYPKGFPSDGDPTLTGWFPWSDNFSDPIAVQKPAMRGDGNYGDVLVYPQPILADIEFDIDGSMVLGFGDRFSFQTGNRNYAPNSSATYTITGSTNMGYSSVVAGDILRAYSNGTTYVLENNAKAGPSVGAGQANNQGPGFGEFYNDNFLIFGDRLAHAENANGGLALRPGSAETIYVAMDPENGVPDSGGLRKVSNTSGQPTGAITITTGFITSGLFAKAASLGDLEIACATPTYLEIGNRVWLDTDKDGIQDPCEKALANVKVALYQGNTLIANTTTDANGEYYFSNGSDVNAVSRLLLPNTTYTVRFGTDGTNSQFDNATGVLTVDGGKYNVTTAFSTAPTASTLNDSNAQLSGGFLSANVTTSAYGSVNHTIDAGFVCLTTTVATVTPTPVTCTGTTVNSDASISLSGITNADKAFLVAAGGTIPSYTAAGGQTVSGGAVTFSGLANPATAAGQSYSVVVYNGPCCYTVVTTQLPYKDCACVTPTNAVATATPSNVLPGASINLNVTASGTTGSTTYSWSGPNGFAATTQGATATAPTTPGIYTYTVLVSNGPGCTATATASVTVAAPVCSLSIVAMNGPCVQATGLFTVTGFINLVNTTGGNATISDGSITTTVAISPGATSVPYSLPGISSDGLTHTVTVSLPGCGTATTTYLSTANCLCPTGNCYLTIVKKN